MQTKNGGGIPDDEIDFAALGHRSVAIFTYPFRLLARHWITALAFVLCAVALAVALKYVSPRIYRSSFIIRPNDRTEKFHLRIIGDLESLRKERNFTELARLLKTGQNVVEKIAGIETRNLYFKNRSDSINSTEVILSTLDPLIFTELQDAIIAHLERTPYFFKISDLQRRQIDLELAENDRDLKKLDSLKSLQLALYGKNPGVNQSGMLLQDLVNPAAIYSVSSEKVIRRSSLLAREVFARNFQLVKSCVLLKHHHWPPRILLSCLYLVPASLLLCFLFLHFRKVLRRDRIPV